MAVVTVLVTSVDYVFPAIGAKKYGSSKAGLWGAVLGMILGILFFPPFGIIMAILFKLIASGIMTFYFIRALL